MQGAQSPCINGGKSKHAARRARQDAARQADEGKIRTALKRVRELELQVGSEVIAFVKSTEVSIAKL